MIKNYSADYIIPVTSEPISNGVVSVSESGEILGLYEPGSAETEGLLIEKHKGIIVPGFVNSHCHLELSNLFQKFPKKKGLLPFISQVIKERDIDSDTIVLDAIEKADKTMYDNGIVAVGDISNRDISIKTKQKSSLYYHTFLEILCFEPEKSKDTFDKGLELRKKFGALVTSVVPHSAYSVCKELFRSIARLSEEEQSFISIHNQESEEENKFYRYKTGGFVDLYEKLNSNIEFFKPQARNSIQSILPLLPVNQSVMLVHNTYTSLKDIYFVRRFGRDITWCFCPNANLYIEDKLPKIDMFLFGDFSITIGTDSLASNNELCILSELKTINKYFPSIPFSKTVGWATLNGAKFLNIDKRFGSIEKGKYPGLNLISHTDGLKISDASTVKKLI